MERFKTQLIMPLYQAPRRNVNTPAPGKKLTGRWYRVKENDDRLKLFYGKNLFGRIHYVSLRDPNLVPAFPLIT